MTEFQANNISKIFNRRHVLKNVSFSLKQGTSLGLTGRNGSGKTTLLSILTGRIIADSGSVLLDEKTVLRSIHGIDKNFRELFLKEMGFVPHDLFIYGDLSPAENLDLAAKLYDVEERSSKILKILDTANLLKDKNRPAKFLSRGNMQKLAIGRLMLINPSVWLLDEPASGLDQESRKWLYSMLKDEISKGRIIIFSTHSVEDLDNLASETLILRAGKMPENVRRNGADWAQKVFDSIL
jgi:ABC-type multidrug transport system ATPase subunit